MDRKLIAQEYFILVVDNCIFGETKNLNRYFSKYKRSELKTKLKEIKRNEYW